MDTALYLSLVARRMWPILCVQTPRLLTACRLAIAGLLVALEQR